MKELYVVRLDDTNITLVTGMYFSQSRHSTGTIEKYINELLEYEKEIVHRQLIKSQLKDKQKQASLIIYILETSKLNKNKENLLEQDISGCRCYRF